MANRTHYRIYVTFTYCDGTPGGVLDTTVNSKSAVNIQLAADRQWLAIKGHTLNTVEVTPVN